MDYYQTLGVARNASQEEIKKAYKKLAMQHHPDRGGDTAKFQEIQEAYRTLGDPDNRAEYDMRGYGSRQHARDAADEFQFSFGDGTFSFAFDPRTGQFRQTNQRRNRDLTIRVPITLKQAYTGTEIEAQYTTPSGKIKTVAVEVPAGINHGQTIRYAGLGDDTVVAMAPGNLNVQILVEDDPNYQRVHNDLYAPLKLNALEAMVGCTKRAKLPDDTELEVKIRPGVEHGVEFEALGKGFKDINSERRGRFVMVIQVEIPAVTDPTIKEELEKLYARITTSNQSQSNP